MSLKLFSHRFGPTTWPVENPTAFPSHNHVWRCGHWGWPMALDRAIRQWGMHGKLPRSMIRTWWRSSALIYIFPTSNLLEHGMMFQKKNIYPWVWTKDLIWWYGLDWDRYDSGWWKLLSFGILPPMPKYAWVFYWYSPRNYFRSQRERGLHQRATKMGVSLPCKITHRIIPVRKSLDENIVEFQSWPFLMPHDFVPKMNSKKLLRFTWLVCVWTKS